MPNKSICNAVVPITFLFSFLLTASALASTAASLSPPKGCETVSGTTPRKLASRAMTEVFPPPQLDIRTPLEPTLMPSADRNYLIYELHFHSFIESPVTLHSIEVIDSESKPEQAVAVITGAQLAEQVKLAGPDDKDGLPRIGGGQSAVAYLCLAFDHNAAVPRKLRHRVLLDGATADSPVIDTHHTHMKVLAPPLTGANWRAGNGPSIESHHRTGLFVAGGAAQIARRYAIDWKIYEDGKMYSGDARDVSSYFAYGKNVLAVADGVIVQARDGMPNNIPRTKDGFAPAVPITMDTVMGNFIVLALGDGQFAQYVHLQPDSLRVKVGERVKRGQILARVGNSGDARWPHLHFQISDNSDILASEGLPYLIDQFKLKLPDGIWELRNNEFPLNDGVIDFGPEKFGSR
ncbi:M23 family metallopeptidase [Janthinobacterium sp. HLS12-2]|uniref:M23 family metallopeptidase n=1 Tax=Janthinobacterium sp. HLS12-2 TaxID=1259324 RepID=UPI003F1FFFFA